MPASSAAEFPTGRARPARGIGGPMPWTALTAGACGIFAVVPLALVAILLWGLGGFSSDGAREPWVWLIFLAPLLQLVATGWLLLRRGWVPLLVVFAPSAAIVVATYVAADGDPVGIGPLLLVLFPVLAVGFALAAPTRRWLADRPTRGTGRG